MLSTSSVGVRAPRVLLPRAGIDMHKWAVVAVDQFTTKLDYWTEVDALVGDEPSTLRVVYPEDDKPQRIADIHANMKKYMEQGVFQEYSGFVYVERLARGKLRKGLMALLDLEQYSYEKGSKSLVRATEGTIVARLPPRIEIRSGAPVEAPHILVLIDDPSHTVIEPLAGRKDKMKLLYDTELMMNSGHVAGWLVDDVEEDRILRALCELSDPATHGAKYSLPPDTPVLLYAMGDGNHSLATAKDIWEAEKKKGADDVMDSPLRWALVEIENIHDTGIEFEAIHRVLFNLAPNADIVAELTHRMPGFKSTPVGNLDALNAAIAVQTEGVHRFGMVSAAGMWVCEANPFGNVASGTLQRALDAIIEDGLVLGNEKGKKIDYVHGDEQTVSDATPKGNVGFILPAMLKSDLFRGVILDGALPRKTFSMGEADEKRFYVEARALQ